ncbi:MAG: alpha-L-rhamnosidase, partial [Acetatifactor sp.]|nr:alpha-L-rhamnosidase [Acetatifactor sp.]
WLRDVAADQTAEGGVPHVVPDIISGKEENDWLLSQGTHSAAAWADVAVINPWTLYLVFGDREILEEQYDSMRKWIDFMREHSTDYIWNYRLQFGDWVALDAEEGSYFGATPNDLTCTAYFAYSTGLFAKIAGILGREEDAASYHGLYERIVEKFRETFFREDGVMTAQTQTAHILALHFDLVPEAFREKTAARLAELLEKENGHLVTGFVGTPYFCHALSRNGYEKEAYELLLKEDFPSWLYQVKMGATTVWEHWDGMKPDGTMWSPDMNSFNHYAYGAVGDWLYRVVLGMEIDEKDPGYHHSIISPQTGDAFDFAEGTYESIYGSLKVRWEKAEGGEARRLRITVPHNTAAEIRLEKGAEQIRAEGLRFEAKGGVFTAKCGSGEWEIIYRKKRQNGLV